jgi:formate dehydrogenase subunit gamma
MHRLIRAGALALAFCTAAGSALAQAPAPAAPPATAASAVAAPEPRPDDTNAQRARSQPGNNAPMWRAVRDQGGTSSLPGAEKGVLIQPFTQYPGSRWTNAGEAWRQVRNHWLIPYGGSLLIIVALAIALFYWRKGPLGHAPNDGTGPIERFTPFERAAHWTNAIAFVALAVSGIVMAYGKFFLLPLIGATLFGWLTYALKTLHNLVGPLFAVSLVIVILTFIRDELPRRGDLRWLARFGGMLSGREIPSHRFNAGEKLIFWAGVLLLGLTVVGSGLVMDKLVPGLPYLRADMQLAHMVHNTAAVLMMALFLGHIYIGTIGMRGAYSAMRNGHVNEDWAREHHELWYEDIRAGRIPAQRSNEAPATPPTARA